MNAPVGKTIRRRFSRIGESVSLRCRARETEDSGGADEDRRDSYAVLTAAGAAAFHSAATDHLRCVQKLFFDALSMHAGAVLLDIMMRLSAHLSEKGAR